MEGKTTVATLPWPPSVNHYWQVRGKRRFLSRRASSWRYESVTILRGLGTRYSGPVEITISFSPPDRRRRDLDNHTKGVLDALIHAGVIPDDSAQVVKRLVLEWEPPKKPGFVKVFIRLYKNRSVV